MNREKVKQILLQGDTVSYHVWTFSERFMSCYHDLGCCDYDFKDVEECLNHINNLCNGDWEEVSED